MLTSLIIVALCIAYIVYTSKSGQNLSRHLTNEYHYAHFSAITRNNWILKPSLMRTTPMRLSVSTGQSLWIPRGWWHWIETLRPSIAINLWKEVVTLNPSVDYPKIIPTTFQTARLLKRLKKGIKNQKIFDVWDSNNDKVETLEFDLNKRNDHKYVITLPGYTGDSVTNKLNQSLIDIVSTHIHVPPEMFGDDCEKVDKNLWVSSGFHDTGLHYDDYYGLLCVLEGEKRVTLYPPSDTKYLEPLCILPFWAKGQPIQFEYNTYTHIAVLDSKVNLPSSRLLYESILSFNNKNIMKEVSRVIEDIGTNSVVWGCKLMNGVCRWELYFYHYTDNVNDRKPSQNKNRFMRGKHKAQVDAFVAKQCEQLIIHSFDLYNTDDVLGDDVHMYYNKTTSLSLPFIGHGTTIKADGTETWESNFILDTQPRFTRKFDEYVKTIQLTKVDKFRTILNKYQCDNVCVFKKNKKEIFILYLGISINDFLSFVKEHHYSPQFVSHVVMNRSFYTNIKHEVAIVYDKKTMKPVRTAFYGLV